VTALASQTPLTVTFGRRARDLRNDRGWSLEAMAARSGVGRATVHRIECGENTTLAKAEKVAAAFGMTLAEMLSPEVPG
jgi:transcriptional regulator with XRE-family HTH domain